MDTILEIIKYTFPALIVFLTVYFMMKNYLSNQLAITSMKFRQEQMSEMLPLKLQAYERLALFTERISINNLSFRLSAKNMDARSLSNAMMVAIQQEYEHNLSQQIYISDRLWQIISLAKDQMQNIISQASGGLAPTATASDLMASIENLQRDAKADPTAQARMAIKKEIEIVL